MFSLQSVNDQVLCLYLYNKEILVLIERYKNFWDPELMDPTDESGSRRKIGKTLRALNIFGVVMISLGIAYTTFCICLSMLPIKYWMPQNYEYLENVMTVTEGVWFLYSCISVLAFNTLFIGFCSIICVQYRLISKRLQNIVGFGTESEELKAEFKAIVEHHIFILQ